MEESSAWLAAARSATCARSFSASACNASLVPRRAAISLLRRCRVRRADSRLLNRLRAVIFRSDKGHSHTDQNKGFCLERPSYSQGSPVQDSGAPKEQFFHVRCSVEMPHLNPKTAWKPENHSSETQTGVLRQNLKPPCQANLPHSPQLDQ